MWDRRSFTTSYNPVRLSSGAVVSAANGQRMIYSESNREYILDVTHNTRLEPLFGRLQSPVYTSVYSAGEDGLCFHVLKASELDENGLKWSEDYNCTITHEGRIKESTENRICYWIYGSGRRLLKENMISSPENGKKLCENLDKFFPRIPFLGWHPEERAENLFAHLLKGKLNRLDTRAVHPLSLPFGIELEFTGLARRPAAKVVANCLDSTSTYVGGSMHEHHIPDRSGRIWKIVRDGSITPEMSHPYSSPDVCRCELVTPICSYFDDIETIKKIVRELRNNGMKVSPSCGMHVHVDLGAHSGIPIMNLVNMMATKENLIFQTLDVKPERASYCEKLNKGFLRDVRIRYCYDAKDVARTWKQNCHDRFYALNLYSLFDDNKGVEFRCFNSTTDEKVMLAYIQLALSMCMHAATLAWSSWDTYSVASDRQQFRSWMQRMQMKGPLFEEARKYYLPRLSNQTLRLARASV